MSSQLFQQTRSLVAEDPRAPAAVSALDELARTESAAVALEASAGARKSLVAKGDLDGAELLFARELALAPGAPARAGVLAEMGRFFRDLRRDKAQAVTCFVSAFELDTTRSDLLEEVGHVYDEKESFEDLAERLKQEALAAKDPVTGARWWAERADVLLRMVDQRDLALAAAWDSLKLDPMNLRARGIAESVLIQESRWDELATFYKRAARDTTDPNDAVALLFRLASTYRDKLKDPLQTMETYERIAGTAPNNIRIYSLIDELKSDRETWQKVGQGLVKMAKDAAAKGETDDSALHWALAGKVYLQYLADDATAADCYLSLVKTDPTMPGALKALRDVAARRNDPRLLARGLADAAKGTPDPNRRRDLHRELGALYRGPLAAPSLAAEAFAAALALDPGDTVAAESLEALYSELGEWEALAEHLQKHAAAAPPDRAPALLARRGDVLATHLGQPVAAAESYEAALKLEPAHRPSLLALERVYRDSKQFTDLARVYRGLRDGAPDAAEALRVHKALAAVLLEQLHDPAGSAAELDQAIRLDRSDRGAWEMLEAARVATGQWKELLELYAAVPAEMPFRDLARSWYRKAAEICARRLEDPAQAALWYRRARLIDPLDASLRDALAAQYSAAKAWSDLVMLLQEQAQGASDPAEGAQAYLRAGAVAEEKMAAPDQARALYEAAAKKAPADPAPLKALERIYLRSQSWNELAAVYGAQAKLSRDPETRAAVIRRLARLERDKTHRPAAAAEAYSALVELIPDDREAIDALRTLLADQQRWKELLATHAKALSLSTENVAKAQILREMATLLKTELKDPDGALVRLEEALAIEPENREALEEAASLYAARGRYKELIDVRLRALAHVPAPEQVAIRLQIAAASEKLSPPDLDAAHGYYLQALDGDPRNAEGFSGLRRIANARDDAKGLAELCDRELALSPPDARRVELYMDLGRLAETRLGDPGQAMACYQAAADLAPAFVDPYTGMRRLLALRGAWAEYAKVAEAEASRTADPEIAASLHRELAALWADRFGQPARAADHLRKVLELLPGDQDALARLAVCLESGGDTAERERVLSALSSTATRVEDRVDALKQRAAIAFKERHSPDEAIALYREAIELSPDDADALGALATLLESKKLYREMLPVLTARRRALVGGAERARTLRTLGDLWRLHLRDAASAAEAYREALQEEPDAASLTHLADVVDDVAAFRVDAGRVRARAVAVRAPDSLRSQIEIAAGNAWLVRFGESSLAAEAFAAAIALDPRSMPARAGLENALESASRWAELAAAQEDGAEADPDATRAARRFGRAAVVARDKLEDPERAITDLKRAIEKRPDILAATFPEDRSARDALVALYARQKRFDDLRDLYLAAIERAPANPTERSPLRLGLGDLYRDRLNLAAEAAQQYQLAATEDPRNSRAHESLAELAAASGDDARYALHAAAAAEALGPHPRAAAWLRRAADASLRSGNAPQAATLARSALALEPRDAAGLESLARALRAKAEKAGAKGDKTARADQAAAAREDWDELARTLGRRLALPVAAGGRRGLLAAELASIHAERRSDPEEAARVWERALSERASALTVSRDEEAAGDHPKSADAADLAAAVDEDRLVAQQAAIFFEKTEHWSGLASALSRLSEIDAEPERPKHLRRLAEVLAEKLGDRAGAARALERLGELDAGDMGALASLVSLYRESREWEKLLKVYERTAAAARTPAESAETLRALAEVWEKRLGSAEGAVGAYRRLLEVLPADAEGAEGLRRCLTALGRWAPLAEADEAAIHASPPAKRGELWLEIARLKRDRLDDHRGAAQAFEQLLADEVPLDLKPVALAELAQVYVDLGRWRDAARVERERAYFASGPKEAAERIVAAATLLAQWVADPGLAIELLEGARGHALEGQGLTEPLVPDEDLLDAALEALYEKTGKHDELEKLLASKPQTAHTRRKRAALLGGPLEKPREAMAHYRAVLLADSSDMESAKKLAELARLTRDRRELALALDCLLEHEADPSKKALLLCDAAAEAYRGKAKIAALHRAVEVDPGCRRAVTSLRERAERHEDWDGAVEWLVREEALAHSASDRAELLGRHAHALASSGKGMNAIGVWKQAIGLAPQRTEFLQRLADEAFEQEDWEEAAKACEKLARAGTTDEAKAAELSRRQGEIALRRSLEDEAIAHFQDALSRQPDWPAVQKPLARLYLGRAQWKLAAGTLASLLEHASDLSDTDRIEARVHLGEAFARLGDHKGAGAAFRQVLEEKPGHLAATLGLAEALAESGDGTEALEFLEKFAAESRDVERRRDALQRIGELKLAFGDHDGARTAFADAVQADPSDRRAVEALAKLYGERGDWLGALHALTELAGATAVGAARAQVYREIAETCDKGLGDQMKAREFYEKALADDPSDAESERALGALLGRLGHWSDLAEHLTTRIASADARARAELQLEYGRILRDRLEKPGEAATVLGDAVAAAPERADLRREWAKALAATEGRSKEAVAEYRRLVGADPADLDALSGLAAAAAKQGEDWRAEAANAALAWCGVKAADAPRRKGSFAAATGARLEDASIRACLIDPAEANPFFDALREIEEQAPEVFAAIDPEPAGPAAPLSGEAARLADAAANLAMVLGAPAPQCVLSKGDLPQLLAGRPPRLALPAVGATPAVLFALGRQIDALRDSRHRIVLRDAAGVQGLFAALASAALGEGAGGPASPDLVRSLKKTFGWRTRRVIKTILEPLAPRVTAFDFVGWRAAIGRTGARAGLLVCGDLATALDAVAHAPADTAPERRAERLRSDAAAADLVRWSLSDDYGRLRAELLRSVK